jgi:hypothetical protein
MEMRIPTRVQGDRGEMSALHWLSCIGARVWIPLGHSPDADLVAELDGGLTRIQVKTSTFRRNDRFEVMLSTRGGNRSWNARIGPSSCVRRLTSIRSAGGAPELESRT